MNDLDLTLNQRKAKKSNKTRIYLSADQRAFAPRRVQQLNQNSIMILETF